jgi:hypothetical protein
MRAGRAARHVRSFRIHYEIGMLEMTQRRGRTAALIVLAVLGLLASAGGTAFAVFGGPAAAALNPAPTWGKAAAIPSLTGLNKGGDAAADDISCPAAGACTVAGVFAPGQWPARGVCRGRTERQLRQGGRAARHWRAQRGPCVSELGGLSCPPAGNCTAGGYYLDGSGHQQAFVASHLADAMGRLVAMRSTRRPLRRAGSAPLTPRLGRAAG